MTNPASAIQTSGKGAPLMQARNNYNQGPAAHHVHQTDDIRAQTSQAIKTFDGTATTATGTNQVG